MPNYTYKCDSCNNTLDIFHSMKESPIIPCPNCENVMSRILFPPKIVSSVGSRGEPKTIGGLADQNSSQLSDDEKSNLLDETVSKKRPTIPGPEPFYKKDQKISDKELAKLTPKQKQNYIMTGKKD